MSDDPTGRNAGLRRADAERLKRRNKNPDLPKHIRAVEPWDCRKCGQTHPALKCQSHSLLLDENDDKIPDPDKPGSYLQKPCRMNPMPGSRYCSHHEDPNAISSGKLAEIEARQSADVRILQMLHDPTAKPVEDVAAEFAKMVGVLRNAFHSAGARVNKLSSVGVQTAAGGEQLRAEVVLWERLIHHLRSALVDMARLGIEERRVRLDETRGNKLATGLQEAVLEFGRRVPALTNDDVDLLRDLLAGVLEKLVADDDPTPPEIIGQVV